MKKENAITLIALIITIIIMLILVGIVLTFTIGENGIISKAKKSAEEYKIAATKEKIELAVVDYEVKMRNETIYSLLDKIEGMQCIEPDNEQAGLPYTVIVDGYEFLVKEGIEVIYQGKANGIVPEITSISKDVINEEKVKIRVEAKTKDTDGLEKLILIKNNVEIETKEVNGKSVVEEFSVNGNGNYKIKVVGKNKRRVISQEIQVTEMTIGSATISAGSIIDGGVTLTVTGEIPNNKVTKVEIYEGTNLIKEITYQEERTQIQQEYQIEYMPFYEEKIYTAKVVADESNKATTNELTIKNTNTIKTEDDVRKLANVVNNKEESFEDKTIKQIENITLTKAHTPIGSINAPFKGNYDGQEKPINGLTITNTSAENQGLFGYIENATLQNIVLENGNITAGNKIGGAVGYAKNSTINNIVNNSTNITGNIAYNDFITQFLDWSYGTTIEPGGNVTFVSTGGICGKAESTNIQNCINLSNVMIPEAYTTQYAGVGGIVGYAQSENARIVNCTNRGNVTNGWAVAGIVGYTDGYIELEKCTNRGNILGYVSIGGISGLSLGSKVTDCKNEGDLVGTVFVGGITGNATSKSLSNYFEIQDSVNEGTITSTGYSGTYYTNEGTTGSGNTAGTGGILGFCTKSKITNCYNTGTIINQKDGPNGIGGIAGELRNGEISACYNKGQIGTNTTGYCRGGILGYGGYNVKVNNCYNEGKVLGYMSIGGIVGLGVNIDVRYCYNKGPIEGESSIAGILGHVGPFNKASYENYLYYCYNIGNITGTNQSGSINGYFKYLDTDYIYSLENTIATNSNWGGGAYALNATQQGIFNKETLTSTVLSNFGENFKADYTGTESVNDGFPILSWQPKRTIEE